jgi:acyl dehydratase
MTLTRLIFPGDTLTLQREVVGVAGSGDETLVTLKVVFVNQDGQPVQTGEARVRVPSETTPP